MSGGARGTAPRTGRGRSREAAADQLGLELEGLDLPVATPAVPSGRGAPSGRVLGAVEIATALGRDLPTHEQVAVIEAPVEPLLVVAGAGSGKTETMAARVVWLVANGMAEPQEILGLTFTRKAAAELADRIRARLRALHRRGLTGQEPAAVPVSTYHAYAAEVLSDHGLRLGVEPAARLLGEAGAWQLAADVVERWDGDLGRLDKTARSVTEDVLSLAGECAEHLLEPGQVDEFVVDLIRAILDLPAETGEQVPGAPKGPIRDRLARMAGARALVPVVQAYARRKRELEVLDFGDQVALAARIARSVPQVGAGERERFRVVLLDEYQDTSHAQLVLLRALFGGGHPVTAVGDPHQSIYGWRGASAGNLQRFPTDFPAPGGRPAETRMLSTSWRNDAAVLAVANRLAAPLRTPVEWERATAVPVPRLAARPGVGPGRVRLAWHASVEDEARAVAEAVEAAWRSSDPPPSAAVLCRARAQFPLVEAALRARGLPVEVVGLGGLLHVPEIADLRAALEVLHDPTRGDSLMRLLVGPACRLGPRDLEVLGEWAAHLARRWRPRNTGPVHHDSAHAGRPGQGPADVTGPAAGVTQDSVEDRSLVEAVADPPDGAWTTSAGHQLSVEGRRRVVRLSRLLHDLRGRSVALGLAELVAQTEQALLLDVEVAARPGARPGAARANLDAFLDVAAAFAQGGDRSGLGAFLAWLAAADQRERGLEAPLTEIRSDAVQVLTVHAAKGLEWDVVAVTGLVEGTFPTGHAGRPPSTSFGWVGAHGAVPYPLRGDRAGLPQLDLAAVRSQKELTAAFETFRGQCGAHEVAQERRLAYVAVTRARRLLLLTGAIWGDGSTPREPSRFLTEAADLAATEQVPTLDVSAWQQPPDPGEENPRDALHAVAPWPNDPLGAHRGELEHAAALVRAELVRPSGGGSDQPAESAAAHPTPAGERPAGDRAAGDPPAGDQAAGERGRDWAAESALLLAERDVGLRRVVEVQLPDHLSASRLVALAQDPVALAARLRRPMPEPPSPHARRGSAFHAWLERRFASAALVDLEDLPGAADEGGDDPDLVDLQQRFLSSVWAQDTPEAVEVTVETPVDGVIVRGRIDAVFRRPDARGDCWDVVDWKTGPPPSTPERARALAVQLAVYRLAWARLQGVSVERVGAAFFYASTGLTSRPADLLDEAGLSDLVRLGV